MIDNNQKNTKEKEEKVISFPLIVFAKTSDGWIRQVQYNYPLSQFLIDVPAEPEVITHMVKQYVDKDGDLTDRDLFHFLNWSISFQRLDEETKKKSGMQVSIIEL